MEREVRDEYIRKNKDFTNAYIKSKLFSDRFFKGLKLKGNSSNTNKENIDNMIKHLKKAEYFFECMKELSDKLNDYNNSNNDNTEQDN